jgi:hypothetical protein
MLSSGMITPPFYFSWKLHSLVFKDGNKSRRSRILAVIWNWFDSLLSCQLNYFERAKEIREGWPLLTVETEVNGEMGTQGVQMKRVLP